MENTKDIMKECMKEDNRQQKKIIQILMSTYNGEKYLREQLESFIQLENFEEVKVLIRDDGSTDSTLDILYEYSDRYGFEVIEGTNVGVNKSMTILFSCADEKCEFFALSDQDDVWFPDKLIRAKKKMLENSYDIPLLFASLSCVTNENLEPIGSSVFPYKSVGFYNAMIENICPGHTQVFNKPMLLELMKYDTDGIFVIDYWIYLVASAIGKIIYEKEFTVYHRQHGNNAVGYKTSVIQKTLSRIKRLKIKSADPTTIQLKYFYDVYKNKLPKEYETEIFNFLYSHKKIQTRIKYAIETKAYRQTTFETLIYKMLYISGKYHI